MASTAVGATVLYYLFVGVGILLLGVRSGGDLETVFFTSAAVGLHSGAISLSAVVAPLLFLTGTTAWRLVSPSQRYGGAIGGLLATGLAYLVAGTLVIGLGSVYAVVTGSPLIGGVGIIGVAFLASSWIAVPASIRTGTLYERSLGD
jgi:hypothetical protein